MGEVWHERNETTLTETYTYKLDVLPNAAIVVPDGITLDWIDALTLRVTLPTEMVSLDVMQAITDQLIR